MEQQLGRRPLKCGKDCATQPLRDPQPVPHPPEPSPIDTGKGSLDTQKDYVRVRRRVPQELLHRGLKAHDIRGHLTASDESTQRSVNKGARHRPQGRIEHLRKHLLGGAAEREGPKAGRKHCMRVVHPCRCLRGRRHPNLLEEVWDGVAADHCLVELVQQSQPCTFSKSPAHIWHPVRAGSRAWGAGAQRLEVLVEHGSQSPNEGLHIIGEGVWVGRITLGPNAVYKPDLRFRAPSADI